MPTRGGKQTQATRRGKATNKAASKRIDRPFAADKMKAAWKIVNDYQIIVECEEGEWYGRGLELPRTFMATGRRQPRASRTLARLWRRRWPS